MFRVLALVATLGSLTVLAQGKVPPGSIPADHDPRNTGTEQQKCQAKCGEGMSQCMIPCLGGNPDEAAKPENRSKTMACVKKCSDAQAPCMKSCESKKKTP